MYFSFSLKQTTKHNSKLLRFAKPLSMLLNSTHISMFVPPFFLLGKVQCLRKPTCLHDSCPELAHSGRSSFFAKMHGTCTAKPTAARGLLHRCVYCHMALHSVAAWQSSQACMSLPWQWRCQLRHCRCCFNAANRGTLPPGSWY